MGGLAKDVRNMSLGIKLSMMFCLFGLLPIGALGWMAWHTGQDLEQKAGKQFENAAVAMADKIDRNLFERYGDVQAFTFNDRIRRITQWYDHTEDSALAPLLDQYIQTYEIYYLTLLVDTQGSLIAVNHHDADGELLNYQPLFKKNYSQKSWFQALEKGEFTTSTPFSAPENQGSTGTFIEDVHVDADVQALYPGDSSLTWPASSGSSPKVAW